MSELPSLVMIEWEDSAQAAPQWQWLSDFSAPAMARCISVGFLVKDTEEEKSLAISLANADDLDSAQIAGIITIPAKCITRMERLTSSLLASVYQEPASAQWPQAF